MGRFKIKLKVASEKEDIWAGYDLNKYYEGDPKFPCLGCKGPLGKWVKEKSGTTSPYCYSCRLKRPDDAPFGFCPVRGCENYMDSEYGEIVGKCVECRTGEEQKPPDDSIKIPGGNPVTRETVEVGKTTEFEHELTDAQKVKRQAIISRWESKPVKEWYNPALGVYFMEMPYSSGTTMTIGIDPDGRSRS